MKQLHYPLTNIGLSGDPDTHGYNAYDFYWYNNPDTGRDAGAHPPLYACGDGVVVKVRDGCPDYRVDSYGYGNYIVIRYDSGYNGYDGHYYSLFAHIQNGTFQVSTGDRVKQGQYVANVDNSGHSFGCHLHLETYKDDWGSANRVTATKVLYVSKDQWVDPDVDRHSKVTFLYASQSPIEPVNKDIGSDQAYVPIDNLRVRKAAGLSGEQEGLADVGYYNVDEYIKDVDGYDWAKVGNYYIACGEGLAEYIPAEVTAVKQDTKVNQINVTVDNVRLRKEPNTSADILGWCPVGYLNVLEIKKCDDYTWYKVGENVWVAGVDEVTFIESVNADKERIAQLEKKIEELSEFVKAFAIEYTEKTKIDSQTSPIDDDLKL